MDISLIDSGGRFPIGSDSNIFFAFTNFSLVVVVIFLSETEVMADAPLRRMMASNLLAPSESSAARINPGSPHNFHGPYDTGISWLYHAVHFLPPYSHSAL